ncbi:hypothetical protein LZ30DRAFT_785361 [Colletotrichum cereale]|nr:hypothetical protein LZ30DRAFT_785361 [Colletotrichum cereale]
MLVPIYKSKDLANWDLIPHALKTPGVLPCMSSPPPYGIDPDIFPDPVSGKDNLNLIGSNDNYDRLWGITQCDIDLGTRRCVGLYRIPRNGTLPQLRRARPEGSRIFRRGDWYDLVLAEDGTITCHQAWKECRANPSGIVLNPNVLTLRDRGADVAVDIGGVGPETVMRYLAVPQRGQSSRHSRKKVQELGQPMCIRRSLADAQRTVYETELNRVPLEGVQDPPDLALSISAAPLKYSLGYSRGNATSYMWLKEFDLQQMGSNTKYPDFEGFMFAVLASSSGDIWPYDTPEVCFQRVEEVYYYEENLPDYDS